MVMVLFANAAVTPAGNPVAVPIPVVLEVICVILVNGVFIHKVGVLDAAPAIMFPITVIVPVALTLLQPPVNGIEYVKVPDAVGEPLMVIVLFAHDAVTPAGKLVAAPIPIAPVVVWVILVNAVLMQIVGVLDAVPAVLHHCAYSVTLAAPMV